MKKRPLLPLLASSLLVFSGGCGYLPGSDTVEQVPVPDPNASPGAVPPGGPAAGNTSEVPVGAVKSLPPVDIAALGLIPPVTPSQRRPEIEAGRANPFALLKVEPKVAVAPQIKLVDTNGDGKVDSPAPGKGQLSRPSGRKGGQSKGEVGKFPLDLSPIKGSKPGQGGIPGRKESVPRLYPDDARAVVVSGVIQISQRNYAIVSAPGETVARYVTVGDRLSGGKVRVQAINMGQESPSVTLEQFDQQVIRAVGADPLPPLTPGKAAPEKAETPEAQTAPPNPPTSPSAS